MSTISFKKPFYTVKLNSAAFMLILFFIGTALLSAWIDKIERKLYGVKPGVYIGEYNIGSLYQNEVQLIIREMALKHQQPPVEPAIDRESGGIIPGQNGYQIDIMKNVANIMASKKNQRLELEVIYTSPEHADSELEQAAEVLGAFETWVQGSQQRVNNISLAISGINNYLLWPEESFSFNEAVGPRTIERGFLPAPVIIGGEADIDYGGGVCQIASTLYNAVLASGLRVTERHPHSKPVYYVAEGKDAAVNYGSLDLKFVNNRSGPVIIKAGFYQSKLWVEIKGKENKV
ncbi:MAG: VanW family protein [Syntrophomonadaceae bacterium]|nr:VanW family protein [Syntrophomonadaceae bacterium]